MATKTHKGEGNRLVAVTFTAYDYARTAGNARANGQSIQAWIRLSLGCDPVAAPGGAQPGAGRPRKQGGSK